MILLHSWVADETGEQHATSNINIQPRSRPDFSSEPGRAQDRVRRWRGGRATLRAVLYFSCYILASISGCLFVHLVLKLALNIWWPAARKALPAGMTDMLLIDLGSKFACKKHNFRTINDIFIFIYLNSKTKSRPNQFWYLQVSDHQRDLFMFGKRKFSFCKVLLAIRKKAGERNVLCSVVELCREQCSQALQQTIDQRWSFIIGLWWGEREG